MRKHRHLYLQCTVMKFALNFTLTSHHSHWRHLGTRVSSRFVLDGYEFPAEFVYGDASAESNHRRQVAILHTTRLNSIQTSIECRSPGVNRTRK